MNKTVIIINGAGGAGKDTFCEVISTKYTVKNISSIDPIKMIATYGGWNYSDKSPSGRKLLSDLKKAFIEYNNLPLEYLIEQYNEFLSDENEFLFVHIREADEIKKFRESLSTDNYSLLIKSNRTDNIYFGNASDDEVANYTYDYVYENNCSLTEIHKDMLQFFAGMIRTINNHK